MHSYVRSGLTFDVTDEGPADGRVLIALHGFPEDRRSWSEVIPHLTGQGVRVLAPDQRGYSTGARPRRRRAYALNELTADVLAMADVAGADRFDLVGQDWGAAVAWDLSGRHPDRVRTLTALSVPPAKALRDSVLHSSQVLRSWYMAFFQLPRVPETLLKAAGAERAATSFERQGLDRGTARRYAARVANPADSRGPINWYRAIPFAPRPAAPPVAVPTLFVYGDQDRYLTRTAAERAGRHVAGPYQFEVLDGATHWLPTGAPDEVSKLIVRHLADHPG